MSFTSATGDDDSISDLSFDEKSANSDSEDPGSIGGNNMNNERNRSRKFRYIFISSFVILSLLFLSFVISSLLFLHDKFNVNSNPVKVRLVSYIPCKDESNCFKVFSKDVYVPDYYQQGYVSPPTWKQKNRNDRGFSLVFNEDSTNLISFIEGITKEELPNYFDVLYDDDDDDDEEEKEENKEDDATIFPREELKNEEEEQKEVQNEDKEEEEKHKPDDDDDDEDGIPFWEDEFTEEDFRGKGPNWDELPKALDPLEGMSFDISEDYFCEYSCRDRYDETMEAGPFKIKMTMFGKDRGKVDLKAYHYCKGYAIGSCGSIRIPYDILVSKFEEGDPDGANIKGDKWEWEQPDPFDPNPDSGPEEEEEWWEKF